METIVELKLTVKVPPYKVDEVSQKLVDLLSELGVYDGGKLEQSNITVDI